MLLFLNVVQLWNCWICSIIGLLAWNYHLFWFLSSFGLFCTFPSLLSHLLTLRCTLEQKWTIQYSFIHLSQLFLMVDYRLIIFYPRWFHRFSFLFAYCLLLHRFFHKLSKYLLFLFSLFFLKFLKLSLVSFETHLSLG